MFVLQVIFYEMLSEYRVYLKIKTFINILVLFMFEMLLQIINLILQYHSMSKMSYNYRNNLYGTIQKE